MSWAIVYADGSIAWGQEFDSFGKAQAWLDSLRDAGQTWCEGCRVVQGQISVDGKPDAC